MGVVLPQPVQFGKYTLFERIGRGGMADVFKGRVQGPGGFERVFVVKRILSHLSTDPTFNRMFIEEAKMSARLNHPNIVQVFELGSVEGEYFISMEHVRGRDLSEAMRTLWARIGPPRPELVAYVGREMCRALGYAHELTADDGSPLGMIHRDVSPSNVMLSYEGAVKILDFGIAKALGSESKEEGGTQRGTLKGKFAYMAPEQTSGNDVDKRIDIFATGIVLHEILTGRRLFKGENDLQTVEKVRQCDVPPPSLQNPLCPPELDAIVLKALARNRDDRFHSAAEMADSLDDVVHAARFQPSHLAQLMRDLFPTDVGGGDARNTGARITQTMTGSNSRPLSAPMRSPTLPPVSVSRSPSSLGRPASRSSVSAVAPAGEKAFFKRGSVWAVMMLLGAAFGGGVLYNRSQAPPIMRNAGPAEPTSPAAAGPALVTFDSIPDHVSVYDQGNNKLGDTPFSKTLDLKDDVEMIVVFKKSGYQDESRKVTRYRTVFSTLRPLTPAPTHIEPTPAPQPEPAPEPGPTPTPAPTAAEPAAQTEPPPPAATAPLKPAGNPATPPARPSHDTPHRKSGPKKPKSSSELVNPF